MADPTVINARRRTMLRAAGAAVGAATLAPLGSVRAQLGERAIKFILPVLEK